MDADRAPRRLRGSGLRPVNRFGGPRRAADPDHAQDGPQGAAWLEDPSTRYIPDRSRSIVSTNDSPDIGFRHSVNPYRGCLHGCSYCYARPTHEYLGLDAGLDFESTIVYKPEAGSLFREFLARPGWTAETVVLSGVTDPYQPVERSLGLTSACLEAAEEAGQPVSVITKNALVLRDLDRLARMAARGLAHVNVSLTTLDAELARRMEPRTSLPAGRLEAIRALSAAGVPVRVMVAPVIPGLNDSEIPAILAAAAEAGARSSASILLRLPMAVGPIFLEWLDRTMPARRARIEGLLRQTRQGRLNDPRFGSRMRGSGEIATRIRALHDLFARRHGLDRPLPPLDPSGFRPPAGPGGQRRLF
ncbi:MAG TPA: PA0069 family radical SAM protein [Candidatus Polarisedimenticolia bacterium]|nr:PA0069 family radical SAM protein [Candidatus Polarisedimenticolia bacterium]